MYSCLAIHDPRPWTDAHRAMEAGNTEREGANKEALARFQLVCGEFVLNGLRLLSP